MEELITEFKETGNCTIDIEKTVQGWNDKFSISQWNEEYRLIEQIELFKEGCCKVTISKGQALQLIKEAKLLPIKSGLFRNATTWRTQSNILSEKSRMEKRLKEENDAEQKQFIKSVISEFDEALAYNK